MPRGGGTGIFPAFLTNDELIYIHDIPLSLFDAFITSHYCLVIILKILFPHHKGNYHLFP